MMSPCLIGGSLTMMVKGDLASGEEPSGASQETANDLGRTALRGA